jgi:hypothetical protein
MDQYLEVQMILLTEYGEFIGKKTHISIEQYSTLVKMSKGFFSAGFELTCEDGSFMVFAPEVVAKSVLKIKKKLVSRSKEMEGDDVEEQI